MEDSELRKTIEGRYQIERLLGSGGQGRAYLAHDNEENVHVVLKALVPRSANPQREAEELQAFATRYPDYFPACYDSFFSTELEGALRFIIVMQYIPGRTLIDRRFDVAQVSPHFTHVLQVERFIYSMLDILEALQAQGKVHRDIKPGNIMEEPSGQYKLIDFGLCCTVCVLRENQTASLRTVAGTQAFTAPEAMCGTPLAQSDLYSVGSTAFYLLTGSRYNCFTRTPPLDDSTIPSPHLRDVLCGMLKTKPHKRPSIHEVRVMLEGSRSEPGRASTPVDLVPTAEHRIWLFSGDGRPPASLHGSLSTPDPTPPSPAPSSRDLVHHALELLCAHRYADCIMHFESAVRVEPLSSPAHTMWGLALFMLCRNQEAATRFEVALSLDPRNARAHCYLAHALYRMSRFDEGKEHAATAVHLAPTDCFARGMEAFLTDRPAEAVRHFEVVLQADPGDILVPLYLGAALAGTNQHEAAIEQFEAALRLDPQNSLAHSHWSRALLFLGQYDAAVMHCQEAIRLNPRNDLAHSHWGNALGSLGRHEEAIQHYQEALRLNPNRYSIHNNLGIDLNALKRFEEAILHCQEALRLNPKYTLAHRTWGYALNGLKRYQEAAVQFHEFLRLVPNDPDAHNEVGNAFYARGQYAESIPHYEVALRLDPNYALAHRNLGNALRELKRHQEAAVHFQEFIRLAPKDPNGHNGLGTTFYDRGQYAEARSHFESAVRLDPQDAAFQANLGTALRQAGHTAEAIQCYRRALELVPHYTRAHEELVCALQQQYQQQPR